MDEAKRYLGTRITKDLSDMRVGRSPECRRNVKLHFPHVISCNAWAQRTFDITCIITSKTVSGAGLTIIVSCAAAEVMRDPADKMSGCMRGVSDSGLNGESEEGKAKELEATTASICSIDDCMMLARAFSSAKASFDALRRKAL